MKLNPHWRRDVALLLCGVIVLVVAWLLLGWPWGLIGLGFLAWGFVLQLIVFLRGRASTERP